MSSLLKLENISKVYQKASATIDIFKDIALDIHAKETIAIMGESGAGKSTLLQIMGGLLSPTSGSVYVNDVSLFDLSDQKRAKCRNESIGFVFQFHYLLPEFTALENVWMPSFIGKGQADKARARQILCEVGLEHRLNHKPSELSGGEQQRVAIARAMVMQPKILLADEPTGNLDQKTADIVSEVLFDLMKDRGSLVLVTHSANLAQKADKVYRLNNRELILERTSS